MKRGSLLLIVFGLLVTVYTIFDYIRFKDNRLDRALNIGTNTSKSVKGHLDTLIYRTRDNARNFVDSLANNELSLTELKEFIVDDIGKLEYIAGLTVAYEPFAFDTEERLVSVYYDKKTKQFTRLEDYYDYTDKSLETATWYTQARDSGVPIVTEPYFAEGAGELVFDYAVPVYRPNDQGEKELYCIISYTLAPDEFTEVVNSLIQGNSGYVYLTNNNGLIITHPNRSYLLRHRSLDFTDGDEDDELVEKMLQTESGYINYTSPYTDVASIMFFDTVDLIGWKIAVVYSRTDLLGNPRQLEQKIIHIGLAVSFLVLALIIYFFGLHKGLNHHLWGIATVISLLLLANIAVMWVIQLNLDYSEELENRTRVYSDNALRSFIDRKNYEQRLLGNRQYQEIPTGVFVQELVVTDSYNMSVSGKIWQKWPEGRDLNDNLGFEFLQASPTGRSVIVELLSKDKLDDGTWLYTWKFNATLRIFFDYNQYPLDQHYIDIKLIYPDLTDNIMLVPDFASYEVLNPASRPGMSDIIFLPKHRIIASYFSFSSMDMKTFFGQNRTEASSEYETLEYNIVIKRRFITPFISFVIPFILGASIIFFLLYTLNKDENDKSGVTVMGVVQGMAALFFSMLLAHITIRNRIPTPSVTYLESFYFIIYILIALLILLVVMYSRSDRYKLLNYQDNLVIKVSFWPALVGMLYILTLLKFY